MFQTGRKFEICLLPFDKCRVLRRNISFAMAPLSLEQIGETLARETQAFIETNECVQSTLGTSVGSFFLGFSTGVALQVHYARFLPRRMKAMLLLPAVLGMTAASAAHKNALKQCEKEWRGSETLQLASGTTEEVKCVKV